MYILSISVNSSEKYFNTQCYSNPIRVAKMPSSSSLTNSTNNNNNEPSSNNQNNNNKNYVLRYKAIDNTISLNLEEANKIRASIYNCMENYNISVTNLELTSNHNLSSTSSRRRRQSQTATNNNNNITIITLTFYSSNSNPTFVNNLSKLNISDMLIFVSATINGVTYGDEKSVNTCVISS